MPHRRELVDHAFDRTRRELRLRAAELAPMLERHGLALDREALADPARSFQAALERQRQADGRVTKDLGAALDRLERVFGLKPAISRTGASRRWSARDRDRSRRS